MFLLFAVAMVLLAETRLSLTDLAKKAGVNTSTTWRWANRGVRGIILETFHIAGRRFTTEEAFERFVEATTAAANGQPVPSHTARQREVSIAAAEREAEKLGI